MILRTCYGKKRTLLIHVAYHIRFTVDDLIEYRLHQQQYRRTNCTCYAPQSWLWQQESPADADKPAQRETMPKTVPIRRENQLQIT